MPKINHKIKFCPKCGLKLESGNVELCPQCGFNFKRRKKFIDESEIYADFFQRFAAFFIDSIIISILTWIVMSLIHLPIVLTDPISLYSSFYYIWIGTFFNWVLGFFYCFLMESYNNGQTLGKRVLHIRTVDEESLTIADPDRYALTNIIKTSPFVFIDFLVGVLMSERESNKVLRLFQYLSKTLVIETDR